MVPDKATVPPDYFRRLYRLNEDPWDFAGSSYEREKYEATIAALPRGRYRSALELGCSIGVFTRLLAERCEEVLAVDVSVDALISAARRCAGLAHVRFAPCDLSRAFPAGSYDLITLCELGFYFSPTHLAQIRESVARVLERDGDLILVHWTPPVNGHAQTAAEVHAAFLTDQRFVARASAVAPTYRLDVVSRA
jgi:SAM-dependent methyltransferase